MQNSRKKFRHGFIVLSVSLVWGLLTLAQADELDLVASRSSCARGIANGCYNLGASLFNEQRIDEAFEKFKLACDKDMGQACYQMGRIEEGRGNTTEAKAWFEQARRLGYEPASLTVPRSNSRKPITLDEPKAHLEK